MERQVAVQIHAANGIVIGQCPEDVATVAAARELIAELRNEARKGAGNLIVLHCDSEWRNSLPMWGDPEPSWPLMIKLKQQLDPHGLLNPGRFVDGSR